MEGRRGRRGEDGGGESEGEDGAKTHFADDLVEQEEVELGEDEEDGGGEEVPRRPDFVEHAEHDV